MSDDLLTTLRFEVDGSGVATGLTSVKRSITDLGNAVKDITDKTNAALGKVGTEELPVAKGLEKASKSIIKQTGDIEKAIATFGSTASTSLKQAYKDINAEEVRLRGMGIDAAIMNPYLEKLREVQKLTAAVAAQERTLAQGAAQAVEAENQRLAHTLELKRQIASVKTTVDNNNAAAQAAKQAEIEAQQKFKLLGLNNQIQAAQKAAADAQAAQSAKAIKDLKDLTAAQAAYRQEVINSELNFTHTGRGKSTAFLADKGQRLGFDSSFIEKELAGYKKVEDAAKAAFQAANPHIAEMSKRAADAGTSVKGLSASMRNVPAQFTDIIVSLQGGQAPLTVLLQQGGQLKDMFGGVGNAARALGGYVVDLINPFTVAAGVVGTLGLAYIKGAAEGEAYNKALITTGNAAGVTAGQLGNMAKAVAQATGGTVGAAAEALAGLAGTSGIAASQFEKIAAVAVQMEKVTGVAVADTVKQFAELGKDPVGASLKLTESTKYLTAEVYEQIRALVEQGKTLEAGAVAQNAFIESSNSRMPELKENLGIVEKLWLSITGAIKGAGDAVKEIGRDKSLEDQIAAIKNKLAGKTARSNYWDGGKALDAELVTLQRMLASQKSAAFYRAEKIKQEEASIRLSETAYKNEKDRTVLMERERAKVKADYESSAKSLRDTENYEKAIAQIKERYKEKASATAKTKSESLSEYDKLIAKLGQELPKATAEAEAAQHGYNKAQTEFIALVGGDSWGKFTNDQRATVAALYERKIASEQSEAATKALAKAEQEAAKAQADYMEKLGNAGAKEVAALETRLQKQTQHNAEIGKTAEQIEAVRRVAEEAATAELESQAKAIQLLLDKEGGLVDLANTQYTVSEAAKPIYELELKTLRDQIALRKQIAKGYGEGEQKEASAAAAKEAKKAAKDAAKEWQKTADKINDSITDALMRGFESGKGFAENLRDTVENIFKTMVLRPVVQATVNTGLGALGIPGVGGSSGGAGGLLNAASNLNTLYGTASQALFGASVGASTASLVGANAVGAVGGDALGALIAGNGGWAGVAVAAEAGAAAGAASGAAAASAAGSAGAAGAAAIPGIGWAIGGALLLAGLLGGDNGPKLASTGDAIRRYDKGGALTENASNGAWFFTNTQDANKLLDGLESRYQKAAKALGIGTVATQFDYGSNNRGNFALAGAAGNSRANTGEIAYSAEAMQVAASRAVFAALQGSELPKYLSGLLDSVGDINALSQAQIDDVLNTAQAYKGLHDVMVQMPFEDLHDLSYNAAKGLIEFSGGLDKLTQNLGTYYENFYSAEEKKAQTLANITKTLTDAGALTKTTRTAIAGEFDLTTGPTGMSVSLEQRYATSFEDIDMPKTREEFRALTESLKDLGGEAAQKAYAALLSVSGAFASITPAATDATAALEKDLAARASWQQKLDVLTGKTTEQQIERANDLAGVTDAATKALIQQVHAQQDIAASATKAADAMKAVAAANASIQGSKTQIYNVENAIAPERAALTAAQEAWAGSIKEIKDIAVNSFGQSQSDVDKWGAEDIEGFKVEDFADSEFFDAVQQALTDYWANKAALVTANDTFAKAETAAKKVPIDTQHDGLAQFNKIRDDELSLKARLYELTGDAGKLAEVIKEQREIVIAGLSTTQADLQRQIWTAEDKAALTGGAGKDILAERNSLQAELNALTDTAAQALARHRDALDESNQALFDRIQILTKRKAVGEERKSLQEQYDQLTMTSTQLLEKQRAALDESNQALFDNIQIETKRKAVTEQAGSLADRLAIANGTSTALEISRKNELATALDAGNKATLLAIYAAEDLVTAREKDAASATKAAQEASTNATEALAGVQRAVDAQKKLAQVQVDVAQESVANLTSIFDTLKSSVAQLYGSVDSTTQQSATQGQAFIAQALSVAKATGYLPDADDLADAVAAAMQGVGGNVYKSQADADFAKLSLAGSLSGLKDISKTGLTTAEKALQTAKDQLTTLDKTLETAREQLDAANGINTSVLSVATALDLLNTSIADLIAANSAKALADAAAIRSTGTPVTPAVVAPAHRGTIYEATTGLTALYGPEYLNRLGGNLSDLYAAAKAAGLPGFASGINYVPHDMTARIHEGEAVVPKAFNPFNPNAQGAGNARLESLVEGLTAEVQRLQSIVNDGNTHQRRTADAVNGSPEMPMLVETV